METQDGNDKKIITLSDLRPKNESPFEAMSRDEILDEAEMALDQAKAKITLLWQNPIVQINKHDLQVVEQRVGLLCKRIVVVGDDFQREIVNELLQNLAFIIYLLDRINNDKSPFTVQSLKEIKELLEKAQTALEESLKVDLPEVEQTKGGVILTMGWEE